MKNAFLLFCLFYLAFSGHVQAQTKPDPVPVQPFRNAVYLEFGGNAYIGSLNYERRFFAAAKPATTFALRIGGLYVPFKGRNGEPEYLLAVPVEASAFWGKRAV